MTGALAKGGSGVASGAKASGSLVEGSDRVRSVASVADGRSRAGPVSSALFAASGSGSSVGAIEFATLEVILAIGIHGLVKGQGKIILVQ